MISTWAVWRTLEIKVWTDDPEVGAKLANPAGPRSDEIRLASVMGAVVCNEHVTYFRMTPLRKPIILDSRSLLHISWEERKGAEGQGFGSGACQRGGACVYSSIS